MQTSVEMALFCIVTTNSDRYDLKIKIVEQLSVKTTRFVYYK